MTVNFLLFDLLLPYVHAMPICMLNMQVKSNIFVTENHHLFLHIHIF